MELGWGRAEAETVYQAGEVDLAEAVAILDKRGQMPPMGKEPAQGYQDWLYRRVSINLEFSLRN